MTARKRLIFLLLIMTAVSFILVSVSVFLLYNTAIEQEKERLIEAAQSQARLIESIARFDVSYSKGYPGGPEAATLSQIESAHNRYKGFGKTGEFALARLVQDKINFLISHAHFDVDHPNPVPFESKNAEPMRRALLGQSGTMIGRDYRGNTVLAAYEPVSELNMGIVVKIDLKEVQAPFKRSILLTFLVSMLLVLGGAGLFFRTTNPIIERLEGYSSELRAANDKLKQEINARILVEDSLKWELSAKTAFSELYEPLISTARSIEEITYIILEKGKALTASIHGYVSLIDPLTGDNIVYTFTQMSNTQCRLPEDQRRTVFPRREDGRYPGLWGHALNTGEGFFTNAPEKHEASFGIPNGHIQIKRFLSVPVKLEQVMVGQIALANKDKDYTEKDLEAIRRLAEYFALAIRQKKAEEDIYLEKDNFVNILDAIEDGVCIINQHFEIEYINPPLKKEFGEVEGKKCYQYFHERKEPCPWCKYKEIFEGKTIRWELDFSKNQKTYDLIDTPLKRADGTISKLQIFRDITEIKRARDVLHRSHDELENLVAERTVELSQANISLTEEIAQRKDAEEQLQKNKDMLQTVFDGISDPLVLFGSDMSVKMLNKSAAEYYGLTNADEVLGKPCHIGLQGEAFPCEGCQVPISLLKNEKTTFERKGLKDPRLFEIVVMYPLEGKDGQTEDVIKRITDVTERKLFERQLIQSEKMASLGMLVSSITHEINNPNTFISFNLPILREYLLELLNITDEHAVVNPDFELLHMSYDEFRKDILNLIDNLEHGSQRINSFVSNLREFSRIKIMSKGDWTDLKLVLEKALAISRTKIGKTVKSIKMDIPMDVHTIYTDSNALEHVLVNLLINAAQAADKVDSWIKISAKAGDSWLDHTIIEVKDNGCGIDEKDIKNIFDPFFTTKTPAEGTGLGLYVCHNLITGLGGSIEVDSEPGEYATFRVILPDKERRNKPRS